MQLHLETGWSRVWRWGGWTAPKERGHHDPDGRNPLRTEDAQLVDLGREARSIAWERGRQCLPGAFPAGPTLRAAVDHRLQRCGDHRGPRQRPASPPRRVERRDGPPARRVSGERPLRRAAARGGREGGEAQDRPCRRRGRVPCCPDLERPRRLGEVLRCQLRRLRWCCDVLRRTLGPADGGRYLAQVRGLASCRFCGRRLVCWLGRALGDGHDGEVVLH